MNVTNVLWIELANFPLAKVEHYYHADITKNRMCCLLFRNMRHLFRYLFSLLIFQPYSEH